MDSTEQTVNTDSNTEQPNEVTGDKVETQSQTYTVGGQELTWEQLAENYKNLQWEFTRKTQELSKNKKESELSDEDKAAVDFIKQNWFVTTNDLENMTKKQAHEARLTDIITSNPDLKSFESAIREIWKSWDMAYEDIIQKFWFKAGDKLAKARSQWDVKWMPESKEKSIKDMTPEQYAKHKVKMGWTQNGWTFT